MSKDTQEFKHEEESYYPETIFKNSFGQFAKVISVQDGLYRINGWGTEAVARDSQLATININAYGLNAAGVEVVELGKKPKKDDEEAEDVSFTKTKLKKMTPDELKSQALLVGLDAEGTKEEILNRLYAHYEL